MLTCDSYLIAEHFIEVKWTSTPAYSLSSLSASLLGLKHATDADHVVAVANIVRKQRNIWQSIWLGASWGAGHSVPLLILGTIVLIAKDFALERYEAIAPFLEIGVGIMLIYLGVSTAWNVLRGKLHIHQHDHGAGPHVHVHATHPPQASHSRQAQHKSNSKNHNSFFFLGKPVFRVKSFAIGIVHGLAGSAAVMVLLLPTIDSTLTGLGYIALFSIGTMLSMAILTIIPRLARSKSRSLKTSQPQPSHYPNRRKRPQHRHRHHLNLRNYSRHDHHAVLKRQSLYATMSDVFD